MWRSVRPVPFVTEGNSHGVDMFLIMSHGNSRDDSGGRSWIGSEWSLRSVRVVIRDLHGVLHDIYRGGLVRIAGWWSSEVVRLSSIVRRSQGVVAVHAVHAEVEEED